MNWEYFTTLNYNLLVTGMIYGIGAIGLGLIYKYLKFPDFTTTVSFSAGSIAMAVYSENHIAFGILGSIIIGMFFGSFTFLQIRYIKIPPILAGIITWIGSLSIMFLMTGNNSVVNISSENSILLNSIISSKDSIWNFFKILLIAITICYGISAIFKYKYGLYILALLGTPKYLEHRHKKKNLATFILLVFGNGLISFSGGLLTIMNKNADVKGSPEFLVIALSGYVIAQFIIYIFSSKSSKQYLEVENKPSGNLIYKFLLLIADKFKLNDEEPIKIFISLFLIIVGSTFVQFLFQYIDTNYSENQGVTHIAKASIFFLALAFMRGYEYLINLKFGNNE
jgi:putative ABC transport system permease protein